MNNEDTRRDLKRKFPHVDRLQEHGSYNKNLLPPGWLGCPAYGQEIGCIIPSKVPLGESFDDIITSQKYSPKQAILQQRHLGRQIGLVIDLTNTTRYYPISDWTRERIRHVKIRCKGRDSVPDDESVNRFCNEVLGFLSRRTNTNEYIFVHCTHGHNRTGYMIVHFLVRTESISVTEAMNKFSAARDPGIYKQDYIDALYMYYHERKPEEVVCPQTPEWKRLADPEFHRAVDKSVENIGGVPLHENITRNGVLTNDDVLGDPVHSNQLHSMRLECYQLLKLGTGGRGSLQFPGSHPVSLNRDNVQLLRQRYYYATWKADGTRFMMLITCDGCYLIDRKFHFRKVHMRFPCRYLNGGTPEKNHHYTLLDGEMIIDKDPHTQKQERRYLIYDLMAINRVSVTEMRRKGFWLLSTVSKLLNKFIPQLSHPSDGLVFQGWDDPYVPRTHEGLLKWKYPEMNSVDFLFELGAGGRYLLFLHERGRKKLMEGNRAFLKDASDASSYSGKIIECYWDPKENHWVCMRIRTDKSTPNEINTYRKVLHTNVMRSIKDNITEEVVLNEMNEIIRLPLYADRIERDIKAHQQMVSAKRK
ncbi:uncharacterized protein LOC129320405 isoform X3 [Prosopis cineraria]|uniref:uncharacterized protein LOC129320405 isoform X3 n=1 Tax=Prosopis cineraria TaxID=364024 RepID=UPI00240EEC4F|nr:uncharacterized protein LOC129320405 isoform X3 [Prosopis cineraria]